MVRRIPIHKIIINIKEWSGLQVNTSVDYHTIKAEYVTDWFILFFFLSFFFYFENNGLRHAVANMITQQHSVVIHSIVRIIKHFTQFSFFCFSCYFFLLSALFMSTEGSKVPMQQEERHKRQTNMRKGKGREAYATKLHWNDLQSATILQQCSRDNMF